MFDSNFLSFAERLKEFIGRKGSHPTDFNQLAIELFKLQCERVPPYQSYCKTTSVSPEKIDDWRSIPALPISAFKDFEVTSLAPAERTTVFYSSGTTSQRRSRNFHDAASLELYRISATAWAEECLIGETRAPVRMLFLTPPTIIAPHSSLVYMFDAFSEAFAGGRARFAGRLGKDEGWEIDYGMAAEVLHEAIAANESVAILGTAYNYVHLLDQLTEAGHRFELPHGSWALETGGYKGRSRSLSKQDLYTAIQDGFGIPRDRIFSEYGMCELSSQAYQISKWPRSFHFPPWVRTRVVSPETEREVPPGQPGLLQVFDLANVRSVLAIQTEDIAIARENGFELIGRASRAEQRGCSLMAIQS